jgi:hypothetical protein
MCAVITGVVHVVFAVSSCILSLAPLFMVVFAVITMLLVHCLQPLFLPCRDVLCEHAPHHALELAGGSWGCS